MTVFYAGASWWWWWSRLQWPWYGWLVVVGDDVVVEGDCLILGVGSGCWGGEWLLL